MKGQCEYRPLSAPMQVRAKLEVRGVRWLMERRLSIELHETV